VQTQAPVRQQTMVIRSAPPAFGHLQNQGRGRGSTSRVAGSLVNCDTICAQVYTCVSVCWRHGSLVGYGGRGGLLRRSCAAGTSHSTSMPLALVAEQGPSWSSNARGHKAECGPIQTLCSQKHTSKGLPYFAAARGHARTAAAELWTRLLHHPSPCFSRPPSIHCLCMLPSMQSLRGL